MYSERMFHFVVFRFVMRALVRMGGSNSHPSQQQRWSGDGADGAQPKMGCEYIQYKNSLVRHKGETY